MITLKELLTSECSNKEHLENLEDLLLKLNVVRAAYGKPLRITSGYRSLEDHLRIYRQKGIVDQAKIPMRSKHLYGQAADLTTIEDDVKHFQEWVLSNIRLFEEQGLYLEGFAYTKTWVHVQIVPPKSGNRFFIP
jgi:uncharacterized protein YcbK (DUF882 family)